MKYSLLFMLFINSISFNAIAEFKPAKTWSKAKNILDDKVYHDHRFTFYCGCNYKSHNDKDGSGDINADACGLGNVTKMRNVRDTIQWEHIVPASLMPVGKYMCWQKEKEVSQCKNKDGKVTKKNRTCCEKVSPSGKIMIFDLFNLTPSAAQLNQYRTNDPYGKIPDDAAFEGFGEQCTARDLNGTKSGSGGLFEPPDCKKGDVARTWFYMRLAHGVTIDSDTNKLFMSWSKNDPISPWEKIRHDRIAKIQGNINPYVHKKPSSPAGACSWEPK